MLNWYLNRLLSMNFSEFVYRIIQFFKVRFFFYTRFNRNYVNSQYLIRPSSFSLDVSELIIPKIGLSTFAGSWNILEDSFDWHLDKVSCLRFDLKPHYKMNIRSNRTISAKNVWELNRMHFLIPLALNFKSTGEDKFLKRIIFLLNDWNEQNPYLLGINWYSNIEVNIRLINFYYTWEILNAESIENAGFVNFIKQVWVPLIQKHIQYAANHLSYYSSANNHLVSEYSGLFIANSKWKFADSEKLLSFAKNGLEKEIEKQHSDGINREEASEYIQFITDFFYLPYLVGNETDNSFSQNYQNILAEIFDYIYEFRDLKGHIPRYGDDDDGHVLWQELSLKRNNFSSLMLSAYLHTNNLKYLENIDTADLKNQIIFNKKQLIPEYKVNSVLKGSKFYSKQGHYFFRFQKDSNKEIYLHFDAAPLGYLSIAAHGHSDALSFEMNVNGIPIFIDPGTYCYHVEPEWRNYFVSSKAHNTITINNENQAKRSGDTMWHKHYTCTTTQIVQSENLDTVVASHDGYENICHTRKIDFHKDRQEFFIEDSIVNHTSETFSVYYPLHIHRDMDITAVDHNEITLKHHSGIKISVNFESFDVEDSLNKANGEINPINGWNSPSFLVKEKSQVIWFEKKCNKIFDNKLKIKIYEY